MKSRSILCVFLLLVALQSCIRQPEASKIIGTWKLTSYHYGDKDPAVKPAYVNRIKLINFTHFTWVEFMTESKQVMSSAGGRFSFDGIYYTEYIDWAGLSMNNYLGKEQKFQIKIENKKMYRSGQLSDSLKIEEEWIKIE
jgi:hypothetical protein